MHTTILETDALTIGYRVSRKPDTIIAEDIDVSIQAGQLIAVLGPNGAGKSTLLRTLAGMQLPLSGNVRLMGDDLQRLSSAQLAQRLSVVLTERTSPGLLNGYALVALGRHPYTGWTGALSEHDGAMVRWAVKVVGAADFAARPLAELSDGQRQKIYIARALAQEPELMILDEPTAYLDLPRRVETMHLLKHLARETGRAILLSTHDLDLALRTADRLWLMPGGQALRTGTPEDLVLNGAFEAAFHSEGVTFDSWTGAFTVNRPQNGSIALIGSGLTAVWTRRALEREGFTVVDGHATDTEHVEILNGTQPASWRLHRDATVSEYESIQDLIDGLKD